MPMEPRVALKAANESTLVQMIKAFEGAPAAWDVTVWSPSGEHDVLVSDERDGGHVVFDRASPGAAVAAVERVLTTSALRVAAVTGARRGTGVTTLALHLAHALARRHDVCLVDLDPTSSLRARLDLPKDARHWGTVDESVFDAALPVAGGFRILLAPLDRRGADVAQLLRAASARFDRVVVDAPRSPWLGPALSLAATALLVVPPSHQGVAAARETFEQQPTASWACIVNRLGAGGEMTRTSVARQLGRSVAIELPTSPFLRDREDEHRLLAETWSRYYRRVARLAAAL